MRSAPPGLRRLYARADVARRTAERLETGDEVLTPLLADLDGLDLVSGRWIEPLLSVADGSALLERLLEPSPPSPLPPHRSPSPGEGRPLAPVEGKRREGEEIFDDGKDGRVLRGHPFESGHASSGRVPPPLGGGGAGSGGGQVGGSPANPHPPAPSPISHPAPRRERGRKAEEAERTQRTARTAGTGETEKDDLFPSASLSPSPGDRVGGRWERGPGGEDSAPRRSALPSPAGAPPSWPPPLPTTPRPGGEEKNPPRLNDLPAVSPLSRGGGEEGRERGARGVRARLGDVLQRLESSRPTLQTPSLTLPAQGRDLPAFPSSPGGLRGLAALASSISAEEPSSPAALQGPEPEGDDLAERLERLLRREAHRHGIEVEP